MNKLVPIGFAACLLFFLTWQCSFTARPNEATPSQNKLLPASFQGNPAVSGKPQRIVSMSPGNTEILFALGAGDRVVGVTSHSDYPEEATAKDCIGAYNDPDVEKILSLAPDIVFSLGDIQAKPVRVLKQAGIPVMVVEPSTLPEILAAIDVISEAIGEQKRGVMLHTALEKQLNEVQRIAAQSPSKRVFLEIWDAPLLTVGNKSFVNDAVMRAGGINVAAGNPVDYTPCDIETLYAYNPEVYIVISHSRKNSRALLNRPELAGITALQSSQVFQMDDDVLTRPGPRCFTGTLQLAQILHPAAALFRQKE